MSSNARGRARPDSIAQPDVLDNFASFTRHLRAENRAAVYDRRLLQGGRAVRDVPRRAAAPPAVARRRRATRGREAFLVERQDAGMRPATLSQRFRSLGD
jgi:hypothetical protein